jgi:hypothetical protein
VCTPVALSLQFHGIQFSNIFGNHPNLEAFMLWTILGILVTLWLLSFFLKAAREIIHVLLLAASGIALIAILLSEQFVLS